MSDNAESTRPTPTPPTSAKASKRLGRGLGALLGEMQREEPVARRDADGAASAANDGAAVQVSADRGLAMLSVAAIEPHPDQPRRHFDEDALNELAASIAARACSSFSNSPSIVPESALLLSESLRTCVSMALSISPRMPASFCNSS